MMVAGSVALTVGMLLLGPSPLVASALPATSGVVLAGAMVTLGGVGAAMPALTPMTLEVCERHGLTQKQVAAASAGLFGALGHMSSVLGPLLGGAHKASEGGFSRATTLYCLYGGGLATLSCALLLTRYLRRPNAGGLAANDAL